MAAGHEAMVSLFGGKPGDDIDTVRHQRFCQMVATSVVFVHPQSLPPTATATKYHSLRVYLQVHQWLGSEDDINPVNWGWSLASGLLVPKEVDLPSAPPALLSVVRCNCKADCTSARCSCKKYGLECSLACGQCRGVSCANSTVPDDDSEHDEP